MSGETASCHLNHEGQGEGLTVVFVQKITLTGLGLEVGRFRFIKNHDSDSLSIAIPIPWPFLAHFVGIGIRIGIIKGIIFQFTIPHFTNGQKESRFLIYVIAVPGY